MTVLLFEWQLAVAFHCLLIGSKYIQRYDDKKHNKNYQRYQRVNSNAGDTLQVIDKLHCLLFDGYSSLVFGFYIGT